MKNPMTLEQMKQAIDDNAAEYDMQFRLLNVIEHDWTDLHTHDGLDLKRCEYRRKPELIERFVNIFKNGDQSVWKQYKYARKQAKDDNNDIECTIRLVRDPTWTEPEPEEKNPWRPIIKGEWPECKPDANIILKSENGQEWSNYAGYLPWLNSTAIAWRYAEDE